VPDVSTADLSREELWNEYRRRARPEIRERLIVEYLPLVKYVAGRLAIGLPPSVEVGDLVSFGVFGLMDAVEKFDPSRGVKFETYAIARVRGAILDGLRSWDWVPASLRRRAREVEEAYATIEQRLGRAATDSEVAEALHMQVDEFQRLVADLSGTMIMSLDDIWTGHEDERDPKGSYDYIQDENAVDPVALAAFREKKEILAEAIDKLPERERMVISLYYYNGLTVRETSEVMGVSPSRVSQLHSKAILRLRGRLGRLKQSLVDAS